MPVKANTVCTQSKTYIQKKKTPSDIGQFTGKPLPCVLFGFLKSALELKGSKRKLNWKQTNTLAVDLFDCCCLAVRNELSPNVVSCFILSTYYTGKDSGLQEIEGWSVGKDFFRLSILFFQYRSRNDTQEVWTFVVLNTLRVTKKMSNFERIYHLGIAVWSVFWKKKSTSEKDLLHFMPMTRPTFT